MENEAFGRHLIISRASIHRGFELVDRIETFVAETKQNGFISLTKPRASVEGAAAELKKRSSHLVVGNIRLRSFTADFVGISPTGLHRISGGSSSADRLLI